ncbi:ABC transporter transmembrane domain-containing protein [Hyphobacterium sp. CCMP332]|uniref:ABC transporter transmembrane domain-containing protein n=1 Tax=Hyphobacterium sp. CCMP332 TaxID=2749086 RepID=UPI001EFF131D|nr:ABC transporter transmembrane domain-containing protein [Hyphobacterium sp. CCMP332]
MSSTETRHQQADKDRGSGFAAEMERDAAHREKARSAKPLRRLIPYVMRYPALLAAFAVFLVLASGLTLILPGAFRLVVDCGFGGAPDSLACETFSIGPDLSAYFLAGMAVAFCLAIASAFRFYFISRLGERVVADLRRAVFDHLLTLSPSFYVDTRTGEVLSRLTTDTTLIQTVVGSSVSVALRTVATTVGALTLMIFVNWQLALMVLALGPVILLPILLFGRRVQRLSRESQDELANASARAGESLQAIETVQAFTREPEESHRFRDVVESTFAISLKRIGVRAVMTAVIFTVILTGLIAVLWFGAVQVQAEAITPGAMTQFVMYAFVAVSGVGMLTETYAEVMRAAGATERLMELLSARTDISAPDKPVAFPSPVRGELKFSGVTFAYPARPEAIALNDVSFDIQAGETVALVGPSGAGKSTIFQLLLRLYDPASGEIALDGVNAKSVEPQELRRQLAVVQQNAPLFSGSVAENIRFGGPDASDEDVRAAAVAANAHDFIMALPEGYDTQLGESAGTLSGGQRQRIAIARAVLRDAPVLLLDEATSALDPESEQVIQAAFEAAAKDRTTLIIAHRLATVRNADRIIVLEDGRIADQGTHDELLGREGVYKRYIELQFGQA